jgi:hypothetical protein
MGGVKNQSELDAIPAVHRVCVNATLKVFLFDPFCHGAGGVRLTAAV